MSRPNRRQLTSGHGHAATVPTPSTPRPEPLEHSQSPAKPDALLVLPHTSAGVRSSRRYRRRGTDARSAAAASAAAQPLGRRAATICRAGRPGRRHRRPAAAAGVRRDHVQRRDRGPGTGDRGPGGDGGTITGTDSDGGVSVQFPGRRDVTLLLIVQKLGMILKLD